MQKEHGEPQVTTQPWLVGIPVQVLRVGMSEFHPLLLLLRDRQRAGKAILLPSEMRPAQLARIVDSAHEIPRKTERHAKESGIHRAHTRQQKVPQQAREDLPNTSDSRQQSHPTNFNMKNHMQRFTSQDIGSRASVVGIWPSCLTRARFLLRVPKSFFIFVWNGPGHW